MRVAVLPFNAAEGTKPAYGRQFAAFAGEQLRAHAQGDINNVSYLTQIQSEDGTTRMAYVNIADELLPYEQLKDLFEQAEVELVMDGMLTQTGDHFDLIVRFHEKDNPEPVSSDTFSFDKPEIFRNLHRLVKLLADKAQLGLPELLAGETMEFGTEQPQAFLDFLEGYDSLAYIQQANGMVAVEFSPQGAVDALLSAMSADPEFEGPYHVLVQLCRACTQFRIGNYEMLDNALQKATQLRPNEFPAYLVLGELNQAVNNAARAADLFEKALQLNPDDAGLYGRLGMAQLQAGMPVNAERNLRRALELEDEDKPSADMLAMVLQQTGREHEIPRLWKGIVDAHPNNGPAHAKYAVSLINAGKAEEGERAFEHALESLEDNTVVKRWYAPYLATQKNDLDRAMDFYEDVLDVAPNDIQTLTEYAQTLENAGRAFEVPRVLKDILASNPDPNTRAQVLARLIELEQPKRVESVEAAREKLEKEDFNGAISQLKPLRNWLADYWKMWAMLASAYNQTEQYAEAEEASRRLLELFPGCEPAYGEYVTALTGQGRTQDAYQFMQFAASQNPGSLPVHINLALAAKRAGQVDEARQLAKQIREAIGPNEELEPVLAEIES